MTYLISFIGAIVFFFKERLGLFGIFYLSFLPFIVFSGQAVQSLVISIILGFVLLFLFQKPSFKILFYFSLILGISLIIVKPRLGLDMGQLNVINAQRGEHPNFQDSLISKVIHNKTELVHSYINNFDILLSPVAIFASGFWHKISPYYPLGYLYPWDIYFIFLYFKNRKTVFSYKTIVYFVPALLALFALVGLIYLDQAIIFSFAVIYFLALLAAVGYNTSTNKTKMIFLFVNILYLLYQYNITAFFKI